MTTSPVLADYPNPRMNVFLMMRFSSSKQNDAIYESLKQALSHYGMHLLRADQKAYTASLWENVQAYLDASSLGVAVFDQIDNHDFNPNVSIEVGYMLAQGRRVLLLKEKHLTAMPTDLVGHLYTPFDAYNIEKTVTDAVARWLRDTGIAKSPDERLLLYVSKGGTCRCAMAKIVTQRAFQGRTLPFRLRVESVAHSFGGTNVASNGAKLAIAEAFGSDLLADHRVIRRNPGIVEDADLILVMAKGQKRGLPVTKTVAFNEFFGKTGNVTDPWPDDDDDAARERYRRCLTHLRSLIEPNSERLLRALLK